MYDLLRGASDYHHCRVDNYLTEPAEFRRYSSESLELVKNGKLNIAVHAEYPLSTEGIRQTQVDVSGRSTSRMLVVGVAEYILCTSLMGTTRIWRIPMFKSVNP